MSNVSQRLQQEASNKVASPTAPITILEPRFEDDFLSLASSSKNVVGNYDLQVASKNAMLRPSSLASSLSKNLYSAPALQYLDANSFADVLGVSPAFRQKETLRWNSALQVYRQMSCQDLTKLAAGDDQGGLVFNVSETNTEESSLVINNFNDGVPYVNPMTSGNFQHHSSTLLSPDTERVGGMPPFMSTFMSLPSRRCGFLTPPLRQNSIGGELAKRQLVHGVNGGSYVSPGESSLNSLELEAIAAVHELQFAVKDIFVSELLPRTSELIFLNVTTLEGQAYCVELTMKGWRVTSLRHDCMNGDIRYIELHVKFFETIYALMDNISASYRDKFSEALSAKLTLLLQEKTSKEMEPVDRDNNSTYGNPIVVNFLNTFSSSLANHQ